MANLLVTPAGLFDASAEGLGATPPPQYQSTTDGVALYSASWNEALFNSAALGTNVGAFPVDGDVFAGTFTWNGLENTTLLVVSGTDNVLMTEPMTPGKVFDFNVALPAGITASLVTLRSYSGSWSLLAGPVAAGESINCGCDCGFHTETLDQLRTKLHIGLGYSTQVPIATSVLANYNMQINLQQRLVLGDLQEIMNERYFTWAAAAGDYRFCPGENEETCRNLLMASRVSEAWWVSAANVRTRLSRGIPFDFRQGEDPASLPTRYEITSCIEVWPRPAAAGTLVLKGGLSAVDMTADGDMVAVDPTALLLRTLAWMKNQKGHPDAGAYMGQYWERIGQLNADQHLDHDYVTGWLPRDARLRECLTHHMEPRTYGP